jgi:tight adherence protein B
MTPRILRTLGALAAVPLLVAAPLAAHAEDTGGRIDHVETDGDTVSVLYSVPGLPEGVTPDPSSVSVTMDGKEVDATAKTVADSGDTVRRTSVLAIDVSKSMEGEKFAAAQDAARAYVDAAPDDVYIGLVTFASEVTTVQTPTTNHDDLDEAISSLELTPATHLYDGVLQALDETGEDGQRSVLLLSDGIDTTDTELSTVVDQAKETGARVDVVSLDQKVKPGSPLDEISKATGGTVTSTSDSDELEALFTAEATDLAKQLVVSFPAPSSQQQGTLAVSVDADGQAYGDDAFVTLEPSEGTASTGAQELASPDEGFSLPKPALFAGIALLFVGMAVLFAFGATKMMPAEMTPMQQQLSLYTVHGMKRSEKASKSEGSAQLKDSAVAIAQELIDKRDFEQSLNHKLDRAGLKLKAAEWILLHAALTIGAALVGFLLFQNIILALVFLAAGAVLPWFYLSFKEKRRIKAFNGQLAQTLQVIAGALQAGLSLPQAIDTVVQEGQEPMVSEFRRAIIEQRLGVEIEDSLETVAERMGSVDFKWVVMAIRIQREVGGNLAELLLNVAATLREREYLRRQVAVLSAEGRLSAFILGGLPPVFFVYLFLVRPTYIAPMLEEPIGWMMLGAATVSMTIGFFWLKKCVKVEV